MRPPVETAPYVDLKSYLGTWYEFAAIPQSFEKQCVANTTAEYGLTEDGLISVVNSCDTQSGERSVANARAKVVDFKTNSKLKVTFVKFFGWQFLFAGDYWILDVDPSYSYAVVGSPNRDYAWILSRTPSMSAGQIAAASQVLVDQGYDVCQLMTMPQSNGLYVKTSLCNLENGK
jgi:apolipoprotein D and lipocalin family protein